MQQQFPALYAGQEEIRMMFRATHIYLLMAVLVNLMTAIALWNESWINTSSFERFASLLILVSPILFFVGFIIEPPTYQVNRPFSFYGVVSLFVGVVLHLSLSMKTRYHQYSNNQVKP